ncbi:microtubule-associated protein futsch [Caerostris extrusa]|uniref:Microtubule-associated protein futsch n=1 Tax=Caerostris extrusa TaxID=172846 RepID=A0AAV4XJ51_CAEEX|nr:microtubule-associated protein futsch [Caerostris extrusa]
MKKKLMYVEIEIEESVTSTTDASPDTDAPEIPYDGQYKEQVDQDLAPGAEEGYRETKDKGTTESQKDIVKVSKLQHR